MNFDLNVTPAEQEAGKQASRWLIMTAIGTGNGADRGRCALAGAIAGGVGVDR
jgi:hypothetical protein